MTNEEAPHSAAVESTALAHAESPLVLDVAALALGAEVAQISAALDKQRRASVGNLWGAAQAMVLAALSSRAQGPWVALTSSEAEAQGFVEDLAAFGAQAVWLPARESFTGSRAHADVETIRRRLQVVQRIAGPASKRPRLIVASLLSLLQPMTSPAELEKNWLKLQTKQSLDTEALLERLVTAGYTRLPLAEKPGEVSLRGEILDIYPLAAELPLRIELFGDEIESLRSFDPVDQRSVESLKEVQLSLAADSGGVEDGDGVLPSTVLAPTSVYVSVEPMRIEDRAEGLRIQSASHARALLQLTQAMDAHRRLDLMSLPGATLNFDTRSVQALGVGVRESPRVLRETTADGTRVVVLCQNEAEEHRFRTVLAEAGGIAGVEFRVGSVSKGFRLPAQRVAVVNHRELVGILGKRAVTKVQSPHRVRALQSFFELKVGDVVVHSVHGVARFAGLKRMQRGSGEEEHLHLIFAEDVSLFVPAARIDLVQRYIGTGSSTPPMDKIGSTSFRRRKEKVERALFDLATDLLEVQARRALKKRAPWSVDPALMKDMIGSFPWTETPDQLDVDREIDTDLASEKPMDRLLCGDVGFGKTELAIRAAFRVVSGGGQVAVLVPTTVLAQQHHDVFRERLADFPVNVAALSRYVKGGAEKTTVEGIEKGDVDIVIGTHRILSSDLKFKNLGLVIVDEEQRFGVTHKEHFKKLRANVDLLTLSATPIPRTLHMSISGLRDISALTVPPPGRQEIETLLAYAEDEALVREAFLREKNRGGQVFFLHNRVHSIRQTALRLQQLVPECSFAIGHGQMTSGELKGVMDTFTHGDVDVLVATTIIESGLDIPAAGTIVIDNADEFGLSELHQLRGRVGRGTNKAWCYLLVERHKPLREVARERLKALEEMNHLGAGFAISMKDLEIRGAGNILGPQQSGHIAAIGYDMYCRLLKQTVERLEAGGEIEIEELVAEQESSGVELELGLRAFLPDSWIPEAKVRLEILRQLAATRDDADADAALAMLKDRFGRPPPEAEELIRTFRLKARLEQIGVRRLSYRDGVYVIEYRDRVALERGLDLGTVDFRPLRTGLGHLAIPEKHKTPARALSWLEALLHGPRAQTKISR
ncbi:MAG: transcription-repair coupling factor [Planctomycetes bacterium]|nr:transcription-repair coupling factor [Planctomycetota bacterium]